MNLPLFIAGRYLFSKKSHSVINLISAVSAIGVAIGAAALVLILSVYNGFDDIITRSVNETAPDFRISPREGKFFAPSALDPIRGIKGVERIDEVLEEQVYVEYAGAGAITIVRGVDSLYDGGGLLLGEDRALFNTVLARKLKVNARSPLPFTLIYPERDRSISMVNPTSTLIREKVWPLALMDNDGGKSETDLMMVPRSVLERLLGTENEISLAEVRLDSTVTASAALAREIRSALGDAFTVADRTQQNETLYKMMRYEKAAIFLILIFVVIIVAFNIFGSLSMLLLEKKEDIGTLSSLGLRDKEIKKTFVLEGWLISLLGMAFGVIIGVALALLQQHFGLVKMPGNYIISAYPVIIEWTDVLLTVLSVSLIGYVIALLPPKVRASGAVR